VLSFLNIALAYEKQDKAAQQNINTIITNPYIHFASVVKLVDDKPSEVAVNSILPAFSFD
jgi:hypothetical protein